MWNIVNSFLKQKYEFLYILSARQWRKEHDPDIDPEKPGEEDNQRVQRIRSHARDVLEAIHEAQEEVSDDNEQEERTEAGEEVETSAESSSSTSTSSQHSPGPDTDPIRGIETGRGN